MEQLFWIEVTRTDGKKIAVRISDLVSPILTRHRSAQAELRFKGGADVLDVTETPAEVYALIDAQRTNYTVALGDPP